MSAGRRSSGGVPAEVVEDDDYNEPLSSGAEVPTQDAGSPMID